MSAQGSVQRSVVDSEMGSGITGFSSDSSSAMAGDFITLMKPGVLLLVAYTAAVGLFLAPVSLHPLLSVVVLFAISLGCGGAAAFNMWYDRDIDSIMKRTKARPIPKGIISPDTALSFAILLSVTSVMILYMASNALAAGLLAFSIFFYSYIYTVLLKRSTPQNIVIGGAAGAFPPVIGWAAATNSVSSIEPWILFALIFLWTPSHFWALALYRSDDYAKAKVPMLPITAGIKATKKHILFYSLLLVGMSFALPAFSPVTEIYWGASLFLGAVYVALAVRIFVGKKKTESMHLFTYSIFYLFLLFSALTIDVILN